MRLALVGKGCSTTSAPSTYWPTPGYLAGVVAEIARKPMLRRGGTFQPLCCRLCCLLRTSRLQQGMPLLIVAFLEGEPAGEGYVCLQRQEKSTRVRPVRRYATAYSPKYATLLCSAQGHQKQILRVLRTRC